jgi:hypothetical protein
MEVKRETQKGGWSTESHILLDEVKVCVEALQALDTSVLP